jgi:hypothetical protein
MALRIAGGLMLLTVLVNDAITLDQVLLVVLYHGLLSLSAHQANVRFAYKLKSAVTLVIWGASLQPPKAIYLLWAVWGLLVMGMVYTCPGMKLYDMLYETKEANDDR